MRPNKRQTVLSKKNKKMKKIILTISFIFLSVNLFANTTTEKIGEGHITVIAENETTVWYGTFENGVCQWDKTSEQTSCFTSDNSVLNSNEIKDLFVDVNGILWVSTQEAIYQIDNNNLTIFNDTIKGLFAQKSNGDMLVADNYNLYTFDGTTWTDFDMTQVVVEVCCNENDAIWVDENDHIWITHHDFYFYAALRFDGNTWTVFANDEDFTQGFVGPLGTLEVCILPEASSFHNALFIDHNNTTWIGIDFDLYTYENNEWDIVHDGGSLNNPDNSIVTDGQDTLSSNGYKITQDLNDRLWISLGGGHQIAYFDGTTWEVVEDIFTSDVLLNDMEASHFDENIIYIGTNEGLYILRMDVLTGTIGETTLQFKLFLEGAYQNDGTMSTTLQTENLIPLTQPYNEAPYLYDGEEAVTTVPTGAVDWVLVEARIGTPQMSGDRNTTTIETHVAFLMQDGTLQDIDENNGIKFNCLLSNQDYYFCIRHRNHLDILTANPINPTATQFYDLTNDATEAFGNNQLKQSQDGRYVLYTGDYTQDGVIQVSDFDAWKSNPAQLDVYSPLDGTLDGVIQVTDYDAWLTKKAKKGIAEISF